MASVNSHSVTVDKGYFETLVRRNEFDASTFVTGGYSPAGHVSISEVDYKNLLSIARKYENLKLNLIRGGLKTEVVDFLSKDDDAIQKETIPIPVPVDIPPIVADINAKQDDGAPAADHVPQSGMSWRQNRTNHLANANGGGTRHRNKQYAWGYSEEDEVSYDGDTPPDGSARLNGAGKQTFKGQRFDRRCTRSVLLTNLAEGTTHLDITNAVRGGILLEVFLRPYDRSVLVAFLNAKDASNFFDHVRKHDLYIKRKRVDIKWSDSHFTLPSHIAAKIGGGATRNLIIRKIDSRHTEETIRDDLEHIHRLVVIRLEFVGDTCYVKTNSVHNALFAQSCMMSRERYKSTKIDFDVDECAQPYPDRTQARLPKEDGKESLLTKKNSNFMPNRFLLLNLDGEDEEEVSSTFQAKTRIGATA